MIRIHPSDIQATRRLKRLWTVDTVDIWVLTLLTSTEMTIAPSHYLPR